MDKYHSNKKRLLRWTFFSLYLVVILLYLVNLIIIDAKDKKVALIIFFHYFIPASICYH